MSGKSEPLPPSKMPPGVRAYWSHLANDGLEAFVYGGNRLEINTRGAADVHLGVVPADVRVVLREEGLAAGATVAVTAWEPLRFLRLEVPPSLRQVRLDQQVRRLEVRAVSGAPRPELLGPGPRVLQVVRCIVVAKGASAVAEKIAVTNGGLECDNGWSTDTLVGAGDVLLKSVGVLGVATLRPGMRLLAGSKCVLRGEVKWRSRSGAAEEAIPHLSLQSEASAEIAALPPGTQVLLEPGAVLQVVPRGRGIVENFTVIGAGELQIREGGVHGLHCKASETSAPVLRLGNGAEAIGVSGCCVLAGAEPSAVLFGPIVTPVTLRKVLRHLFRLRLRAYVRQLREERSKELRLTSVRSVDGAQLESVSLYELGLSDLDAALKARRLVPWMPATPMDRSERERRMTLRGAPPHSLPPERRYFWGRLARALAEKHTPGAVLANVRVAAMRARRLSARSLTERVLLSLYALVGYGERIFRPLLLHLALSSGLALGVLSYAKKCDECVFTPGGWGSRIGEVALLPLSLFRLTTDRSPLEPAWAVLVIRIVGVVLIGLSLLAMRRIVKAE